VAQEQWDQLLRALKDHRSIDYAHRRAVEFAERAKKLLQGGAPPEQVLELLARGLTNKFLHAPTQALNQAGDAERAELVALFQRIYQLPDSD
jgi:glutamyl-tRNA reductase